MNVSSERMQSLVHAIGAAAHATTFDELGKDAFPHLARALDASAALMFVVEGERAAPRPHALAGEARTLFPTYMEQIASDDPLFRASAVAEGRVHLPVRHAGLRAFRKSRAYADFYRPYGVEDKLYMRFSGAHLTDPGATSMGFLRPRRMPEFGDDEIELAQLALPAFEGAARRIATARRDLEALEALACANGTFALDCNMRILWVSPAAERLLGPLLAESKELPEVLTVAARRLARFAATGELDAMEPAPFSATFDRGDGVMLEADLSVARTSRDEPIVAVSIAQTKPPRALVVQAAARFQLTPAEGDVLALVARGLSNEAIAARQHVSLATVKTHLTRIFRKLGVDSRVQAALVARRLG
jgi:DNA-binding CsgD family transcriptional regulator